MTKEEAKELLFKWFQPTTEPKERERAIIALNMAIRAIDIMEEDIEE